MDAAMEHALHAQKIAWKLGHGRLAVEVYGWAIKNARHLPAPAFAELMDMITGEPKIPA